MKKKIAMLVTTAIVLGLGTSVSASSATTKEYDGRLSNAIAFADKHNLVEGSIGDSADEDTEVTNGLHYDLDLVDEDEVTASIGEKYGDKYVLMNNTLYDIKKGNLTDLELSDQQYDAVKNLKKAVKDSSRYSVVEVGDVKNVEQQLKDRFGKVWYKAELAKDTKDGGNAFVFFTADGSYLDMSYKTTLYYYDSTEKKTIKIDEFGKDKDGYVANVDSIKLIAQDSDNLYFNMNIEVTHSVSGVHNASYILKASKSAKSGSTVKYPNTVSSYLIANSTIADTKLAKVEGIMESAKEYTVYKGVLSAISSTGTDLTVSELKLSRQKVKMDTEGTEVVDSYVVSIDDSDSLNTANYSIDVEGKVWAIYKGDVEYFNGDKFKPSFDVDKTINDLDVYDSNNAVCWSTTEDVFAVRTGSSSSATTTDEEDDEGTTDATTDEHEHDEVVNDKDDISTPSNKPGAGISYQGHWDFDGSANPNWINTDGSLGKDVWVYSENSWYYVNSESKATKGWKLLNEVWYHFDANGKMNSGWTKIDGYWYYFNGNGSMATRWREVEGNWYYLNSTHDGYYGTMRTGWVTDDGDWYLIASNGVMRKGWVKDNDTWYYLNYQGKMLKDCVVDSYYLGPDGSLQDISKRLNGELKKVQEAEKNTQATTNTDTSEGTTYNNTGSNLYNEDTKNNTSSNDSSSIWTGATGVNGF